jgi:predicted phage terminase large subunit-like protein
MSRNPGWEVVLVSAEGSLANKWSRDCRRAIVEKQVPGITLSPDSQAQTEWETTDNGSLIARGVGGQITGRRARLMLIDDPVKNLTDAHSKVNREMLWETWQSVLKTRLRPGSVVVLVMTRWHEDDLAGRLLSQPDSQWEKIRMPALAEADDALGREPGEPLITPQTDETTDEALRRWEQTRAEVGGYVWDALYQQRPAPPGGAVFLSDWWQFHTRASAPPDNEGEWLTSWDLTFGSVKGDFVVGQVWQKYEGIHYLRDQVRGRWSFNEQLSQIRNVANLYPQVTAHLVEKAANGASAIDTLKHELSGIVPVKPEGSKEIRAQAVAPMVEAGQVSLPSDAAFTSDLLAELQGFPNSAPHDDQVDALSQALRRFRKKGTATVHMPGSSSGTMAPSGLGAALRGGF